MYCGRVCMPLQHLLFAVCAKPFSLCSLARLERCSAGKGTAKMRDRENERKMRKKELPKMIAVFIWCRTYVYTTERTTSAPSTTQYQPNNTRNKVPRTLIHYQDELRAQHSQHPNDSIFLLCRNRKMNFSLSVVSAGPKTSANKAENVEATVLPAQLI